jgi:DNA mismatch repair ATPase MutS
VDASTPTSLVLLNESFASTNEREGSEIGRELLRALVETGIRIIYVTHLYDLAASLLGTDLGDPRFLRAERLPDGRRTFRVVPGDPLPTSHGLDVYRAVMGDASQDGEIRIEDGIVHTPPIVA